MMFFYRSWTAKLNLRDPTDPYNDVIYSQFLYHRWGYGALLIITLILGLLFNLAFVFSFIGNRNIRKMPHWTFLCLSVRDLLVSVILIPIVTDWFVVNLGFWNGGKFLCELAGFFDFFLLAEYPLILVTLGITLYTRQYSQEGLDLPMDEMDPMNYPGIRDLTSRSRTPSVAQGGRTPYQSRGPSRPPSVMGSEAGYRPGRQPGQPQNPRTPFYVAPHRPGSVTGSIEGRLAAGRMSGGRRPIQSGPPSVQGSRYGTPRTPGSALPSHMRNQSFRTSSPLHEVDETGSLGEADDLFDSVSLDYPGREFESPKGWDYLMDMEVQYHTWQTVLLCFTWVLSIGVGIPAALIIEHLPSRRPGCLVPVDPFSNPYVSTIDDPGYNLMISMFSLFYLIAAVALIMFLCLILYHKMADKRFRTFLKMYIVLSIIFVISRSPVDIIQFKALIEAARGFNLKDHYEIEYEVILIWFTYLPLILNPIVYFSYLGDYRKGTENFLRKICGCKSKEELSDERMSQYKEEIIKTEKETGSRTQVSNIL